MSGVRLPEWMSAYRGYIAVSRRRFLGGVAAVVLSAAVEASGLGLLGFAASKSRISADEAIVLAAAIALALAASAALRATGDWQFAKAQVALERRLRDAVSDAILQSDWQDFVDQPGHELQSAVLAEAPQVANSTTTFVRGGASLLAAAVIFLSAFVVSVPAALVCGLFAAVIAFAYRRASRGLGDAQRRLAEGNTEITRHTAIMVSGLRTLRLAPVQQLWRDDLATSFDALSSARASDLLIPIRGRTMVDLIGACMIFAVLSIQTVVTGEILSGVIVMALILRVLPRVQTAQQMLTLSRHGEVWVKRWQRRMLALSHPLREDEVEESPSGIADQPVMQIRGLSFRYRGHARPVIADVSLTLDRGEWLCMIGQSGGGKSTLIDLLGGILRPDAGDILIEGVNMQTMRADELHSRVAIVPQDVHLVGNSIEEILTWGERLPRPARFDDVCRDLGVTEMFLFSEAGMSAAVDELSRDLSGGMRTRLAIARALMSEPALLVLDETTSRLPPEAEAAIFESIRTSMPDLAVLVVTHRSETATAVGNTVRLERGRLQIADDAR